MASGAANVVAAWTVVGIVLQGSPGWAQALPSAESASLMFPDPAQREAALQSCAPRQDNVHCLLQRLFKDDPAASAVATSLYADLGHVVGVEEEFMMDGGFRGTIRILPALPTGKERIHLQWVDHALREQDRFFTELSKRAGKPLAYQWKPLGVRFFRSYKRRTPCAYADGSGIAYNVAGSLNRSAHAVDELLFHELFHLNDALHRAWSTTALSAIHGRILKKCGTDRRCLKPFTPNSTTVKGGTYYAFQPGNGVAEYAAELAIRYYQETGAALAGGTQQKRGFKCGPEENGQAWKRLVDEFFGGVDLVPSCWKPAVSPPR